VTAGVLGLDLLIGAATVLAAIVAARLAHSAGLPALLVFLGLGLALGESGIGIRFDNAGLAEVLGLGALVLILAEGGLTTNWAHARPAAPAAIALATLGVAVSIGVAAACTHLMLGLSWRNALLLGAVLAPTDAAAVFSVLRRLPLPPLLSGILEGESGLNDPPAVLTVTLLSQTGAHGTSPAFIVAIVVWELVAGAAIGIMVGLLGTLFLRRVALPASGLYPVAVLALIVAGYGAADLVRASGFLAVYACAVLLGNARLPHGPATRGFAEGVGWLAQIGLFVMLGLLASPARLPAQILPALAVGLVLVLLARPAAVLAAMLPFRMPWRRQAFLSWAGCAARCPSCWRRFRSARACRGPPGCSIRSSSSWWCSRCCRGRPCPGPPGGCGSSRRRNLWRSPWKRPRSRNSTPTCCRRRCPRDPACTAWRSSSCDCLRRRTSP
jgi:cell volume regulation protein A